MTEDAIHDDGVVYISRTLVKVEGKSYPIAAIGSVSIVYARRSVPFIVCIGCVLAAIIEDDQGRRLFLLACALLCVVWGLTKQHRVLLVTAARESQAFSSRSRIRAERVKAAIEIAVATRG